MAKLLHEDGRVTANVQPRNGKRFTFAECYPLLGCDTIEIVDRWIRGQRIRMLVDEEGRLRNRKPNLMATLLVNTTIVGTVLVLEKGDRL